MIKGKNDTAIIKTRTHTSDGRGGVTTDYAVKIAALSCSFQAVRREELRMDMQGESVTEPYMMIYDNITSGPVVEAGDIAEFEGEKYLVVVVAHLTGIGDHTEAVLKRVSGDAIVA
jgi:hypothetical protein